jgi:hypothetical protein
LMNQDGPMANSCSKHRHDRVETTNERDGERD